MRSFFLGCALIFSCLVISFLGASFILTPKPREQTLQSRIYDLIGRISPSVVTVNQLHLSGVDAGKMTVLGSGVIVSKKGIVVTSLHVVDSRDRAYSIQTADGTAYTVEILAQNQREDLAYLQIIPPAGKSLPLFSPAKCSKKTPEIQNIIVSIDASQKGKKISTAWGEILSTDTTIQLPDTRTLNHLYETSARIQSGASGGPVIDMSGVVIGINTAFAGGTDGHSWVTPITEAHIQAFLRGYRE